MAYSGPEFYDDDTIFDAYITRRSRSDNPNDTMEKPLILELAGDVANLRILDLGCGDAGFGRVALDRGCASYLGVDGAYNMVQAARQTLAGTRGEVVHAALEDWTYPSEAFDRVVARLVFHYIEDIGVLFAAVYQSLAGAGRLAFSVEHPIITSCDRSRQRDSRRQDWIVDDYFATGQRITSWMGGQIVKYHRTVEGYFVALQNAGFVVDGVREAEPKREWFQDDDIFQRRRRIPLFLGMSGHKPSS